VLTLVAQDSPLALHTTLEPEKATDLKKSLANREGDSPEVTIADFPNLTGKYLVALPPESPAELQTPGQKDTKEILFYENKEAITLPKKAVQTNDDGTSQVLVKLSEGEPEERVVELGRSTDEKVEILSGLEEGQVILIP
jgi:multidrug efflux pump subunit AcrA (membrane-fusion protein)